MKTKLSETLKENGIDFSFPIEIKNSDGKGTYFETSYGYWSKSEFDADGNETYFENSNGVKRGVPKSQSCNGKVIEIDGVKYKLTRDLL